MNQENKNNRGDQIVYFKVKIPSINDFPIDEQMNIRKIFDKI